MMFQHSGARDFDLGGGFHYSTYSEDVKNVDIFTYCFFDPATVQYCMYALCCEACERTIGIRVTTIYLCSETLPLGQNLAPHCVETP